jgi:hypothetical protein
VQVATFSLPNTNRLGPERKPQVLGDTLYATNQFGRTTATVTVNVQ